MGYLSNGIQLPRDYIASFDFEPENDSGELEMVGITKSGEALYKGLIWLVTALAGLAVWNLQQMHSTQKEMAVGIASMSMRLATLEERTNGSPEKFQELYAKIAALQLSVAENKIRLDDLKEKK